MSGCIATSREISNLHDDMYQLQLKLGEVQRNQADIATKMDSLSTSMKGLNYALDDTKNSMSLLGQRLDDVDAAITQRMGKLSEQISGTPAKTSPPPSELYKLAYSDFSKGKYDLAAAGFRSYLEKFPQGEIADQAQYYIGECHYAQGDWESSLAAFAAVERDHPKSSMVPSARLKQALSLEQQGKTTEMRALLESLIKDFPDSSESFTAKEKLNPKPVPSDEE